MSKRVVSGMRPTGKLHIGHLAGALRNWVQLQEQYDCFYFIADWHALTSHFADTSEMVDTAIDNVADWIGAGIDPERSTLFVQSMIPELQGTDPAAGRKRSLEHRLPRLPFAADSRRRDLQRALCAGR
jgi:tryptophanyl-tRNA synthetase